MSSELERQKSHLRQIMTATHATVWRMFPPELQPDIATLSPLLTVASLTVDMMSIHPNIREPLRTQIVQSQENVHADAALSHVADHDPTTRVIRLRPDTLRMQESDIRRILYHEVATDIFAQAEFIPFDRLRQIDSEKVARIVDHLFGSTMNPCQTHVMKYGFRKILMEGDYAISDLYPQEIISLNQVPPTAFEMITEQIQFRSGNIALFEKDLKAGRIKMKKSEDHPNFFKVLFQLLNFIDWRQFLIAFKTGEIDDVLRDLSPYFGDHTEEVLGSLLLSMDEDEKTTRLLNNSHGRYH